MLKKIFAALGFLLTLLSFYLMLIIGNAPQHKETPVVTPSSLPAVGFANGPHLPDLAALFGAPVPYASLQGSGSVQDQKDLGVTARILTWQDDSGFTVSAVRPAQMAHLIRHEGLSILPTTALSFRGHPLQVSVSDAAVCGYYAEGDTAYALYLPAANTTALSDLLSRLSYTEMTEE